MRGKKGGNRGKVGREATENTREVQPHNTCTCLSQHAFMYILYMNLHLPVRVPISIVVAE